MSCCGPPCFPPCLPFRSPSLPLSRARRRGSPGASWPWRGSCWFVRQCRSWTSWTLVVDAAGGTGPRPSIAFRACRTLGKAVAIRALGAGLRGILLWKCPDKAWVRACVRASRMPATPAHNGQGCTGPRGRGALQARALPLGPCPGCATGPSGPLVFFGGAPGGRRHPTPRPTQVARSGGGGRLGITVDP